MRQIGPVLALALLAVMACGGGDATIEVETSEPAPVPTFGLPETTATAQTSVASQQQESTTTLPRPAFDLEGSLDPAPVVSVIEHGEEPRRILAYDLELDDTASAEMEMGFRTSQALDGVVMASSDLTLTMGMATRVVEIRPGGYVIESTITDIAVASENPAVQETIAEIYAFLPGLSTYVLMGPSGEVYASDTSQLAALAEASGQELDLSLGAVVAPLPDEPVGVGARWTVDVRIVQEFVAISQRATYELVSVEGSVIHVAIELTQVMENEEALGIGLENASTLYQAGGEGVSVLDLTSALPVSSSLTTDQLIEIRGIADGTPIDVVTENQTSVLVRVR